MASSLVSNLANFLGQINGVQTLRLGLARVSGWALHLVQREAPLPPANPDLPQDAIQLRRVIGGVSSADITLEKRLLHARITFLQQAYRSLLPLEGRVSKLSEESFQDAKLHLRLALDLMRRLKFEEAAVRVQSALARAEKSLARGHAESVFEDPQLAQIIFNIPFGRIEDGNVCKEDILAKIEREGLEGYLELLTALLNQHWSAVITLEDLQRKLGHVVCPDMMEEHHGSVVMILGLLAVISRDSHIQSQFRIRWDAFSPRHPLSEVRSVAEEVLSKKK